MFLILQKWNWRITCRDLKWNKVPDDTLIVCMVHIKRFFLFFSFVPVGCVSDGWAHLPYPHSLQKVSRDLGSTYAGPWSSWDWYIECKPYIPWWLHAKHCSGWGTLLLLARFMEKLFFPWFFTSMQLTISSPFSVGEEWVGHKYERASWYGIRNCS